MPKQISPASLRFALLQSQDEGEALLRFKAAR
jgi:hypothetical protein